MLRVLFSMTELIHTAKKNVSSTFGVVLLVFFFVSLYHSSLLFFVVFFFCHVEFFFDQIIDDGKPNRE